MCLIAKPSTGSRGGRCGIWRDFILRGQNMLSRDEFVIRAFVLAAKMPSEPEWACHEYAVDERFIRFKNRKNVDAVCLARMWPNLLQHMLDVTALNTIIMAATNSQPCVNIPMREIARRIRDELV